MAWQRSLVNGTNKDCDAHPTLPAVFRPKLQGYFELGSKTLIRKAHLEGALPYQLHKQPSSVILEETHRTSLNGVIINHLTFRLLKICRAEAVAFPTIRRWFLGV